MNLNDAIADDLATNERAVKAHAYLYLKDAVIRRVGNDKGVTEALLKELDKR